MVQRARDILVIDDNPADVDLAKDTFGSASTPTRIFSAHDGREALAFLRKTGAHQRAPRPDLILLDLNMPGMDGREFLAEMKSDPELWSIPVVVLTTSGAEEDISRSYALRANSYMRKPVEFQQFIEVVDQIEQYWLNSVKLPQAVT